MFYTGNWLLSPCRSRKGKTYRSVADAVVLSA